MENAPPALPVPPVPAAPAPPAPAQAPAPQPVVAPPPQAQAAPPAAVAPQPPVSTNPIPAMANPHIALMFNRMDSDYTIVNHVLQIANQNTLSGEVYDELVAINSDDLEMTRLNFIRVWKTLILKRAQDIFETEKKVRSQNFVRLIRTIALPAPLADLLATLGSFTSHATGHQHHISPPPQAAEAEDFWAVEAPLIVQWNQLTNRMQRQYLMKEYPAQRETDNRPISLTHLHQFGDGTVEIKAGTNEPKLVDAYIRAVNDELFVNDAGHGLADAALIMTPRFNAATVRGAYIASYVLDSNA